MLNCDIRLPPQSTWVQIVIERIILRRVAAIPITVISIPWNYSFHSKFSISLVPNSSSRLLSFRIILFNLFLFYVIIDGLVDTQNNREIRCTNGWIGMQTSPRARSIVGISRGCRAFSLPLACPFFLVRAENNGTPFRSSISIQFELAIDRAHGTDRCNFIDCSTDFSCYRVINRLNRSARIVGTVGVHAEDKLG